MLNIPDSIKALYKTDGVRKNFRVHFPNGEMSDLTNENVVMESVGFSESLMSQSVFRFGLAEASTLEFETVGVGNMLGYTIEAGIEIDTSSLSAADITAIQADEGDGVLVLSADSDIGYGFYRIPLGTFYVDKCPRDHSAMTHRKVTAYSPSTAELVMLPEVEQFKLAHWGVNPSFTPNAKLQVLAILGNNSDETLNAEGYTKTLRATSSGFKQTSPTGSGHIYKGNNRVNYSWSGSKCTASLTTDITDLTIASKQALFTVHAGAHLDIIDKLAEYCTNAGVSLTQPEMGDYGKIYPNMRALVIDMFADIIPCFQFKELETFVTPGGLRKRETMLPSDDIFVYPYRGSKTTALFSVFDSLTIQISGSSSETLVPEGISTDPAALYEWTGTTPNVLLSIQNTNKHQTTGSSGTINVYSFTDCYDPVELIEGYVELFGSFGKTSRSNAVEIVHLSNANPVSVIPGNYEECWWDEFDVEPVGTVIIAYTDSKKNKQSYAIEVGDGRSVYSMENNKLMQIISHSGLSFLENVVKTNFVPKLDVLNFTPVDLTMQGWPWLEAGDALQIEAEDGTIVNTYALRIETKGIQALQSIITSESGEIAGEA